MASSVGGYIVTRDGMEKGYLNIEQLHKHMYTHMGEREFLCSICKCTIENPGCVEEHMWMHLKFYECIICNGGLPDLETFKKHLEFHCDDEGIEIDMMAATQIAEQRIRDTKAQLRFKCRINDSKTMSDKKATSPLQQELPTTVDTIRIKSTPINRKANTNTNTNTNMVTKPIPKPKPKPKSKPKPKPAPKPRSSRKGYYKALPKKANGANVADVQFNQFSHEDYYPFLDETTPVAKIQFDELVGKVFSIIEHE